MKTKSIIAVSVLVSTIALVALFGHLGFGDNGWFGDMHSGGRHHGGSYSQMYDK